MLKRMKELREEKGLTQCRLAELLCVAQTTYSHYETGRTPPPIYVLVALADIYDVSVDYLAERTDQRK